MATKRIEKKKSTEVVNKRQNINIIQD